MAARDFYKEAQLESEARSGNLRWIQARVETIHKTVTAHNVLRRNGIQLRYSEDREEQFSCPFHGIDTHPSARVYPASVNGPSHVWCFVCHQNWDAIALWKKFSGTEKFTRVLSEIERAYGIIPPERPPTVDELLNEADPEELECLQLFETCEFRLTHAKKYFDRQAHLTVGSVLDLVRYQFEQRRLSSPKTKAILRQILTKIGEKIRACPAD